MVIFGHPTRQIHCKIVYYGPGLVGKTTNLQWIYEHLPATWRGERLAIHTQTERAIFFEMTLPAQAAIHGLRVHMHLYTISGAVLEPGIRRNLLKGMDGAVYVASSLPVRLADHAPLLDEMLQSIPHEDRPTFPIVLQYNQRDDPQALPLARLDAQVRPFPWPRIPAIATQGVGVWETLHRICVQVRRRLMQSPPI